MPLQKPLHPYEQSMLLSAMLFDYQHVKDLLSFFPNEQAERMASAQKRFEALPRNERITQIILELRRLLLIDEHGIEWIHNTWIDNALMQEPLYLREIISQSIKHHNCKKGEQDHVGLIPQALIFSAFMEQLTRTPKKTAIYDPILMRLQSLKDEAQEEIFFSIGLGHLQALATTLNADRLIKFLLRNGFNYATLNKPLTLEKNPFDDDKLRRYFLRELISFRPQISLDGTVFLGLTATGCYLSQHKPQWRRAIVLGLKTKLGQLLEQSMKRAATIVIAKDVHAALGDLLLISLDRFESSLAS